MDVIVNVIVHIIVEAVSLLTCTHVVISPNENNHQVCFTQPLIMPDPGPTQSSSIQDYNLDLPQERNQGEHMVISPGPICKEVMHIFCKGEGPWQPVIMGLFTGDGALLLLPGYLLLCGSILTIGGGKENFK